MTNVINLRQARKAKARRDKAQKAGENRVAYGLSKAEKAKRAAEKAQLEKRQEGLRLDKSKASEDD